MRRSNNIFEELLHYPKPPMIDKSAIDINKYSMNENLSASQRFILKQYLKLSGYNKNLDTFYSQLEKLLRVEDKKSGVLFAPVVSATIAIKDDDSKSNPFYKAASLVVAAKSVYEDLYSGKLEPDKLNEQVLEMGLYPNCFSTCQLIENGKVKLYKSSENDFIILIVNGRFYKVDISCINSNSISELVKTFESINELAKNKRDKNYISPGILTCGKNKTQLRIFNDLLQISDNKKSYNIIKNSFLILCLDIDKFPNNNEELLKLAHIGNPSNRWYHSSLQIVVTGNSKAACVCNFSNSISGNVMIRLCEELHNRSKKIKISSEVQSKDISFDSLSWQVGKQDIETVEKELTPFIDDQRATFNLIGLDQNLIKKYKLKTVPVFMIVLQKTIFDLLNYHPAISQFVSMSKFRCIDLTIQNITTKEVLDFIDVWNNHKISKEEKYLLLNNAVSSQQKKLREARNSFPILELLQLNLKTFRGLSYFYRYILFSILVNFYIITGYFKKSAREILVSHPRISSGVSCIGRPGIKIPYVKHFGLHYQIFENEIIITMMPGLKWKIPNQVMMDKLNENIKEFNMMLN